MDIALVVRSAEDLAWARAHIDEAYTKNRKARVALPLDDAEVIFDVTMPSHWYSLYVGCDAPLPLP